jgi:hypothetical protein
MSTLRPAILIGSTAATVAACIATVDHWGGNRAGQPLLLVAVGGWLLLAITTYGERTQRAIKALRADIDVYGDHRHTEGAIDMQRQPIGPVRGLR